MRKIITSLMAVALAVSVFAASPTSRESMRRGEEFFSAGKFNEARRELVGVVDDHSLTPAERQRVECYIALCSIELGEEQAAVLLDNYLSKYPHSVYDNEIRFAAACMAYKQGDYQTALDRFAAVRRIEDARRDEYEFKAGHAKFAVGRTSEAYEQLARVAEKSEYAPHARYYMSYIDYSNGRLDSAKEGFRSIADEEAYSALVPFYLLQIEFQQDNYRYVVENCDALIARATPARRAEIERTAAESWFRLGDYGRTINYLESYAHNGGTMAREEQYLMGYALYRSAYYQRAADYLQSVCGVEDALTQNAAYHLGDCRLKLNDKTRAMQSMALASAMPFDKAIAEDALFNYGKLQYELGGGQFNEAINILTRYIDTYPRSERVTEARECLVAAYYNSKNYDAAYTAIKQMRNPDNNIKSALQKISYFRALERLNEGDTQAAKKLLDESLANSYNAKYTALAGFWQGEILLGEGKYKEAAVKFNRYLQLAPKSEPEYEKAYYNLGYANLHAGNRSQARSNFDSFLWLHKAKDQFRADALNRKGDILYAQRSFDQAIEAYNQSAAIASPERDYALYQRAIVLGLNDKTAAKIEALRSIVRSGEGRYADRAAYELGRTYVSQERYKEGADALNSFVKSYPRSELYVQALADLGLVYQNLGDSDRAMESYKKVLSEAPKSSQARDALAGLRGIYVDNNDVGGYFAYAQKAGIETDMSILQRDSLTYVAAQRLYTSGKLEKAAAAMTSYISEFSKGTYQADALYYRSDCYSRLNRRSEAIASLMELTSMSANDYTLRGTERLASLADAEKRYDVAADAYLALSALTTDAKKQSAAVTGYVRATINTADDERILAMSERVERIAVVEATPLREARYARAKALERADRTQEAMALYKVLAAEPKSREGAEAAYRLIEADYKAGRVVSAEDAIYALSDSQTTHNYWLARAFLTLGDIYRDKGDDFQARATYQSIVDGYSPADDGIVDEARKRIANLKPVQMN
ncbi:MAG: tetratricopeptide repeat protein [Rikenellaceae bacterium]|nr:tetratricopeptide repeat protein [Rikenellaceae bacterium]